MIILQAEKLFKTFPNGKSRIAALDGVDLSIREGESVAILGPSGSGKSTLLSLLAGLDSPSSGHVLLEGIDYRHRTVKQLSKLWGRQIGFIFQSYRLLPTLTAEENVRVPLELAGDPDAREKARERLDQVGLSHRLSHLPAELSGGEQQRVALARAMACAPRILFADEPTGNLDSKTGGEMSDLIFSLTTRQRTTLVMVTHEGALAARARRVIELADGRIVKDALREW